VVVQDRERRAGVSRKQYKSKYSQKARKGKKGTKQRKRKEKKEGDDLTKMVPNRE
jgi:hypothetical protein